MATKRIGREFFCTECGKNITRTTNHGDVCRGHRGPPPGFEGYREPPRHREASAFGCICPPTSEQTCQNPLCPRKAPVFPFNQ